MASTDEHEPTLYDLRGEAVQITYTTSDLQGRPQLAYSGAYGDLSFAGDEIRVGETALGSEVTVVLESGPDRSTVSLTTLIPPVRLGDGRTASLETFGVVTTELSGLAGPPAGQDSRYEVVALTGEATFAES